MRRPLILVLVLIALVISVPLVLWRGPGPIDHKAVVTVPEGATIASASRSLAQIGAIRSARIFRFLAMHLGSHDPIRAGQFDVRPYMSAAAIIDMLQHGRPAQKLVTIPEGMPSILVHDKLMAVKDLTGDFAVPTEGSVLPDTYAYQPGEARLAVVRRMQKAMDVKLAELWIARAPGLAVTTPQQALTLASIVEKETALPQERATVAAVYSNRLRMGMMLQADPTVIYPITQGKPLGRRILLSELRAKNGYNTYAEPGLPEGPIANPGRLSIAAVLHPDDSKALYFVANGKGGHVFSDTLAEQDAAVKQWYTIRHARGEM